MYEAEFQDVCTQAELGHQSNHAFALATFLEQHPTDYITDQLNQVYPDESFQLDQVVFDM
uniref:hypothetical protein n=1 Tax=Candidatus Electrothrix sp. TaxID=2170559 RepID=UPI004056A1D8